MSSPLDLIFGDDWGGGGVAPPFPGVGGSTFLEALVTRLAGSGSLSDLTGVYLTTSPPGAEFPYLVLNVVDELAEVNSSESYYESVQMQFDVLATDADLCLRLGRAAREVLLPRAANPPLAFEDGYEMSRWATRARGPYAEGAGMPEGETVWRYRWETTHMIGRD
jgi:hypothetical protein